MGSRAFGLGCRIVAAFRHVEEQVPGFLAEAAEARLTALARAAEQRRLLDMGESAGRIPDEHLADAGYRTRIVGGRVFVISNRAPSRRSAPSSSETH